MLWAITPFKVIEGHRFWYQSKAHVPLWLPLLHLPLPRQSDDDLRKIFYGYQRMAKVPNGVETLPKISAGWVGHTNVTNNRLMTDRQMTDGQATATFAKNCTGHKRFPGHRCQLLVFD